MQQTVQINWPFGVMPSAAKKEKIIESNAYVSIFVKQIWKKISLNIVQWLTPQPDNCQLIT